MHRSRSVFTGMIAAAIACAAMMTALPASADPAPSPQPAATTQFQIGATSAQDVIASLGSPTASIETSQGLTQVYAATTTHVKGITYVPVLGGLFGGARAKTDSRTYSFDANGLLMSMSKSHGEASSRPSKQFSESM